MIQPLRTLKLWWPAWQMGIPFTSYGYESAVKGEGYRFDVDEEMDSWLCANGHLMPINTSVLHAATPKGFEPLTNAKSFSIEGKRVQVNFSIAGLPHAYSCKWYDLDELYFIGDAYEQDE